MIDVRGIKLPAAMTIFPRPLDIMQAQVCLPAIIVRASKIGQQDNHAVKILKRLLRLIEMQSECSPVKSGQGVIGIPAQNLVIVLNSLLEPLQTIIDFCAILIDVNQ